MSGPAAKSERGIGNWFVAPAALLLLAFILAPFVLAVAISFTNLRLGSPLPVEWTGLRAYQRIVERGERQGNARCLNGLQAETDYDGYGVTLSDGVVQARLLFRGRVAINTPNRKSLESFLRRLEKIG